MQKHVKITKEDEKRLSFPIKQHSKDDFYRSDKPEKLLLHDESEVMMT